MATISTGKDAAANGDAIAIRAIWNRQRTKAMGDPSQRHFLEQHDANCLLAKVLRAETGSSISISCKSCENLLSVTPVSVVEKNVIGELLLVSKFFQDGRIKTYPSTVSRSFLWNTTPERGTMVIINCLLYGQSMTTALEWQNTYQQLIMRKTRAKPPSMP